MEQPFELLQSVLFGIFWVLTFKLVQSNWKIYDYSKRRKNIIYQFFLASFALLHGSKAFDVPHQNSNRTIIMSYVLLSVSLIMIVWLLYEYVRDRRMKKAHD